MIKKLTDITLVAIDTRDPELAVVALNENNEKFQFGKKILLSDKKPFNITSNIIFYKISKINSLFDYSDFILHNLTNYIDTKFCIIIHVDGHICNPDAWSDDFLNYDYIGAPWRSNQYFIDRQNPDSRVGNGGFSLRSKKLLELCQQIPSNGHEDVNICCDSRSFLQSQNIKFAPLEVAIKFSTEEICEDLNHNQEKISSFGFHGKDYSISHKKLYNNILFSFYKKHLLEMNEDRLLFFLKNEAGVSEKDYYGANFSGNLEIKQIPEEYLRLLEFFKTSNITNYLELGVANGGSFFVNCIFLQNTILSGDCVDSLTYRDIPHVQQTEEKILSKINKLNAFFPQKQFSFINSTTDNFFKNICNKKYCCIFIDADHSYEGVFSDYQNSLNYIKNNGYIIFHDIANASTGVARCWNEIKGNHTLVGEFVHPHIKNCGIGVLQIK
jgi:hypothetical protein